MKVGFVSRNQGKLRELRHLLPDWEIELVDTTGIGEETGTTFYENARQKADFGRRVAPPDLWVLAEDSGLEVGGLDGAPGVRSARLAGEHATDSDNVSALLARLRQVTGKDRRGRYRCEIVLLSPDGAEYRGSGELHGRIADGPRGDQGFGYDPIFIPDDDRRTVAELGDRWKARHSHRARAVLALVASVRSRTARG